MRYLNRLFFLKINLPKKQIFNTTLVTCFKVRAMLQCGRCFRWVYGNMRDCVQTWMDDQPLSAYNVWLKMHLRIPNSKKIIIKIIKFLLIIQQCQSAKIRPVQRLHSLFFFLGQNHETHGLIFYCGHTLVALLGIF